MKNSHKSRNIWSVYLVKNSPTVSYQSNVITFYAIFMKKWLVKSHSENVKLQLTKINSYDEIKSNQIIYIRDFFLHVGNYQNRIMTLIIDSILLKFKISYFKLKGTFTRCVPKLFIRKLCKFVWHLSTTTNMYIAHVNKKVFFRKGNF